MRRKARYKVVIYCCCILATFLVFRFMTSRDIDWESMIPADDLGHNLKNVSKHDKWIVVTTINPPTPQLEALANIPGWKLIVVGDRKTPANWKLTNAVYLNTAAQKSLKFRIHKFLPYDSYTRKAMGYLYAIERGALFIYDTDDDNLPYDNLKYFQASHSSSSGALVVETKNISFNPYPHFGQSSLWPRGFPLDHIGNPQPRTYKTCTTGIPAIQQGLVDGDPDVDALFRLTRKQSSINLDLTFDSAAPPVVLPKGVFAPHNSQNSMVTARAFWSLILPTTVSDRATDIYRSYWSQRLLWLLGSNLAFFPPTSLQRRNPHSHIVDATEEAALYQNTGRLMKFLSTWKCDQLFFFDCMHKVTEEMVMLDFLEHRDLELVDAWISDLANVGYVPPSMRQHPEVCMSSVHLPFIHYPWEQNTTMFYSNKPLIMPNINNHPLLMKTVESSCGASTTYHWMSKKDTIQRSQNIVLIVTMNDNVNAIPLMHSLYSLYIPHIVYCGRRLKDLSVLHAWQVSYITPAGDISAASCFSQVMKLNYNVQGYLHISSNMLLLPKFLHVSARNINQVWSMGNPQVAKLSTIDECMQKRLQCQALKKQAVEDLQKKFSDSSLKDTLKNKIKQCFTKIAQDQNIKHDTGVLHLRNHAFYIPQRLSANFRDINAVFSLNEVITHYDFVGFNLMECLEVVPEYLHSADLEESRDGNHNDVISPFYFDKIPVDQVHTSMFCNNINGL